MLTIRVDTAEDTERVFFLNDIERGVISPEGQVQKIKDALDHFSKTDAVTGGSVADMFPNAAQLVV